MNQGDLNNADYCAASELLNLVEISTDLPQMILIFNPIYEEDLDDVDFEGNHDVMLMLVFSWKSERPTVTTN